MRFSNQDGRTSSATMAGLFQAAIEAQSEKGSGARSCVEKFALQSNGAMCSPYSISEVLECLRGPVDGVHMVSESSISQFRGFIEKSCAATSRPHERGGRVRRLVDSWIMVVDSGVDKFEQMGADWLATVRELVVELERLAGPSKWTMSNLLHALANLLWVGVALAGLWVAWCGVRGGVNLLRYAWVSGRIPESVERPGFLQFLLTNPGAFREQLRLLTKAVVAKTERLPEVVIHVDALQYDSKGPYVRVDLAGSSFVARFGKTTLSEVANFTQARPASLPSDDLEGKEAALLGSMEPVSAPLPAHAVLVIIGEKHVGIGHRLGADQLTLARHVYDILVDHPHEVYLGNGKVNYPLEKLEISIKTIKTVDLVVLRVPTGLFSNLGTKVGRVGFAAPGPCKVHWINPLGSPVVSLGRVSTPASKLPGMLAHNCHTAPGSSGAAVIQGSYVVGVHTGSDNATNPKENLAVSLRLFRRDFTTAAVESHFENKSFQERKLEEDTYAAVKALSAKFHGTGLEDALDKVNYTVQGMLFDEDVGDDELEEAEEALEELNNSKDIDQPTRDLFKDWSAVVRKNRQLRALNRLVTQPQRPAPGVDARLESSTGLLSDIKDQSSSTSSTTISPTELATPKAQASSTLEPPKASDPPKGGVKPKELPTSETLSTLARLERENQSLRDKLSAQSLSKRSDSLTPKPEQKPSSTPSATSLPASSHQNNAQPKVSKKASKTPSSTTQ